MVSRDRDDHGEAAAIAPPSVNNQTDGQAAERVEALPSLAGGDVDLNDHGPGPDLSAPVANRASRRAGPEFGSQARELRFRDRPACIAIATD